MWVKFLVLIYLEQIKLSLLKWEKKIFFYIVYYKDRDTIVGGSHKIWGKT